MLSTISPRGISSREFGVSKLTQHVVQQESVQEQLAVMGSDEKHLIALEQRGFRATVVLRVDCTVDDVLYAFVHAYLVLHAKQPLVGLSCACYTRRPSICNLSMDNHMHSMVCLGAYFGLQSLCGPARWPCNECIMMGW